LVRPRHWKVHQALDPKAARQSTVDRRFDEGGGKEGEREGSAAVIDAARARGRIHEDKANPARWKGHLAKLLPKPAKLSRGHRKALPYGDVPSFVKRLRASDNMAALALEFLILTATRTGETLGATWREIDLDNAVWTIPATRMKVTEASVIASTFAVVGSAANAGSTKNTTGKSTFWCASSRSSSKQKHWILLK
jgi:integrase